MSKKKNKHTKYDIPKWLQLLMSGQEHLYRRFCAADDFTDTEEFGALDDVAQDMYSVMLNSLYNSLKMLEMFVGYNLPEGVHSEEDINITITPKEMLEYLGYDEDVIDSIDEDDYDIEIGSSTHHKGIFNFDDDNDDNIPIS